MEWNNLSRVLEEYGDALQNSLKNAYLENDKKASGELIESVRYIITKNEREIEVSLNLAEWWKYIEYGRRPGKFPPTDAIMKWIKIKPVIPTEGVTGKLPTEQQLAFLIGRKIAMKGIEAGNYLTMTVEEVNRNFEYRIIDAINKDIDENLTVIFNEYFTGLN